VEKKSKPKDGRRTEEVLPDEGIEKRGRRKKK
jgi:hypothetical protein